MEENLGKEWEGHLTVDVYQNANEIIVQSAVAGVKGEDIDLDIAKDSVTIKGLRQRPEGLEQNESLHQELHWGKFSRSVILPADIDIEQAKASIKNGLLTIRLPKLKNV
ncbi:MAG: hypothetical protein A2749_02375 [Parcubacteria group bacterium RIFCSPHIGHO2_01_FULL_45_26]|uniref:SHSP domain-containing protein n=1 Tax=Candidatus Yanofskybacteria bacterium RIFCSPLOWO2_02_FULL_43_10b TaxID=1802704 RepID=A0A1F8H3I4_9BACT|nr:MAG: hypothetical protein A3I92_00725 [Candidatus Yanofskybacteria bacterium RIFCSPLOWO2_02_FULL_43_10b]OHB18131.1 MAG: hypothetical protein A2749_02375 [Parcubacteria group bacterium RIFCSPHIGHO2_01_FULL_45_26]